MPNGLAMVEIGADQGDAVGELAAELVAGWPIRIEHDLAGRPRVAVIQRAGRLSVVAPVFPIRLLALDIDGTLVGPDLGLRDRTVEAISGAAVHRGVAVSLVTGRMASSAREFADVLGLTQPIVAHQGAVIREMPERGSRSPGRLLRHVPLPADVARETVLWSRDHGLDPHVNHLERLVIRADDPKADDYSAFLGVRAVLAPDLVEWIQSPVSKVIAVAEPPIRSTRSRPPAASSPAARPQRSATPISWSSWRRASPRAPRSTGWLAASACRCRRPWPSATSTATSR